MTALADGPFADLVKAISECGTKISPDDALGAIEAAADKGSPEALTLIGKLYDGTETVAVIEPDIGLTLGDTDRLAAEYYSRAAAAGGTDAPALLAKTCARLAGSSDTLDASAKEDFCK